MEEALGSLKVLEELILGTISTPEGHRGDGSSQRGLTEGRRAWPAFNDEVAGPVVEGQGRVFYFGFSELLALVNNSAVVLGSPVQERDEHRDGPRG